MKVEVSRFDVADYLRNEAMMADFLAGSWLDSIEDNDPDLFVRALAAVARARGMASVANASGLARESLYKALTPGRKPQFATIQKILHGLGIPFGVLPVSASAKKKPSGVKKASPKRRRRKAVATI